ncbi:MAG: AAA family ATPase [Caulobacteraceae bacterium]
MDSYERFWLRKYAGRAAAGGGETRAKRPSRTLAAWLFTNAGLLGAREPKIDTDDLDGAMGRIDRAAWFAFAPLVANLRKAAEAPAPSGLERRMAWLCETLRLPRLEGDLLRVATRMGVNRTVATLVKSFENSPFGEINGAVLAVLASHDTRSVKQALAPGRPLRLLGLLEDRGGGDFAASKTVLRIARLESTDPARLRNLLIGKTRKAELAWDDFAHIGEAAALAERVLTGALAKRAAGVNILLHGAPGTGKTAFVRTLAERIGAHPMFVGEADEQSEEPTRADRIAAFAIARSMAGRAGRTLLVVDEADDIFTGVDDDDAGSRVGSKVFMNRLVETTAAPTLWITNHGDQLGEAVLRRMSVAIRFPQPGRAVRRRVIEAIAARRKLRLSTAALDGLAEVRAAPAVMDLAVRAARLTGGREADVARAARSVIAAMEGAPVPPPPSAPFAFDPALSAADCDLAALADKVVASGEAALSFCLHGLPGTGKSAFARHLAARLGLDVIEKRASDLLSMYVGESEKAIARAFEEAADSRAMLILDEADSLLRDRAGATRSWEVTQVNEMLTWMERHPWPFAATTNAHGRPGPGDPAAVPVQGAVFADDQRAGAGGVSAEFCRRCAGGAGSAGEPGAGGFCVGGEESAAVDRAESGSVGEDAGGRGGGQAGGRTAADWVLIFTKVQEHVNTRGDATQWSRKILSLLLPNVRRILAASCTGAFYRNSTCNLFNEEGTLCVSKWQLQETR